MKGWITLPARKPSHPRGVFPPTRTSESSKALECPASSDPTFEWAAGKEPRSRKTCLHWLSWVSLAGFFTNSFLWRADIPLPVKNNCKHWLSDLSFLCCDLSKTWHLFELAALRNKKLNFLCSLRPLSVFSQWFWWDGLWNKAEKTRLSERFGDPKVPSTF